jgi:hypothetical protein
LKTKGFDCVEMKRQGAARIYEATKGMNLEQEVAYWRRRGEAFREEQERARQASKPAAGDRTGRN